MLLGKEDALAHLTKYHSAFDEANGDGWLPLHTAAVQLNRNILEITLNGKLLFAPLDTSEECLFLHLNLCGVMGLFQLPNPVCGNKLPTMEKHHFFWLSAVAS